MKDAKRNAIVAQLLRKMVRTLYKEARLEIPDRVYPKKEARRIADRLRAQGMGIDLEGR